MIVIMIMIQNPESKWNMTVGVGGCANCDMRHGTCELWSCILPRKGSVKVSTELTARMSSCLTMGFVSMHLQGEGAHFWSGLGSRSALTCFLCLGDQSDNKKSVRA